MPTYESNIQEPDDPCERTVYEELLAARERNVPVSRYALIQIVRNDHNMKGKEAAEVVETYCDEFFPGTPEYLGKEFLTPFFKVLSLITAALAICLLLWALKLNREKVKVMWMYYTTAGMLTLALIGYLRGIYTEKFGEVKRLARPTPKRAVVQVEDKTETKV